MTKRRGFALAEMAVTMLLLGLLGLLLAAAASASWRGYQRAQADVDLQNEGLAAVRSLSSEAALSDIKTFSVSADGSQVVFLSPRDDNGRVSWDSSGQVIWQRWICFRADDAGALHRAEHRLDTPVASPLPAAAAPDSFVNDRVLTRDLALAGGLRVTLRDNREVAFELRLERSALASRDTASQIVDQVVPRN